MEQQPRFKATYKGEVIGWFDAREDAEAAVEHARQAEENEERDFYFWLQTRGE